MRRYATLHIRPARRSLRLLPPPPPLPAHRRRRPRAARPPHPRPDGRGLQPQHARRGHRVALPGRSARPHRGLVGHRPPGLAGRGQLEARRRAARRPAGLAGPGRTSGHPRRLDRRHDPGWLPRRDPALPPDADGRRHARRPRPSAGRGAGARRAVAGAGRDAHRGIGPASGRPPVEQLLVLLVAYIVLIGPVNYLVLRRLDRREWAWLTMPLLIVVFSAGAFGLGRLLKGSDAVVNEIAIVRGAAGAGSGLGPVYVGVFSPTRRTFDVKVAGGALLSNPISLQQQGAFGQPLDILLGDPARLRGYE